MALFYYESAPKSWSFRVATAGKVDRMVENTWAEHMGAKCYCKIDSAVLPQSDHLGAHIYRPESGPEISIMAAEHFWREDRNQENDLRKLIRQIGRPLPEASVARIAAVSQRLEFALA